MQFRSPAPANLTQEGSTYYADWSVAPSHYNHTSAEVASWVASALNDPRGLPAAGITPRQVPTSSAKVIFQVVDTIPGNPGTIGIAHWYSVPVIVLLEEAYFGNMDLVNHEALHAFAYAIHSPLGTDSLMEPLESPGEEWLSPLDIEQIEAWLAGLTAPVGSVGSTAERWYWFPGDLPHYITKWIVPEGSKTRIVATNMGSSSVVMRAVCNTDYTEMLAGNFQTFGIGVDLTFQGFYASEWTEAPMGEQYVGIIVEGATAADFQNLTVSVAEVQLASSSATGGGSPIPG
jgi:hypothetical protein